MNSKDYHQVDWAVEHFEKAIRVSEVFKQNEVIDVIGITKGKGFKGMLLFVNNTLKTFFIKV